jgi:GGDEF domain-containing protein
MSNLLRSTIALIITLTIFYNIERLDIGTENSLNIETFVYLWGALAVISTISLNPPIDPRYHFYGSALLWLGGYLIAKLYFFGRHPLLGDSYTYLTVTEVAFLLLLIYVANKLAYNLRDFEQAVQNITFAGSDKIGDFEKAAERVQDEMFRSRHYHHPLSVIVVEPEPASMRASINRVVQEAQQKMMARYVLTSLGRMLKDELRRIDLVVKQPEKDCFIILCPEIKTEELTKLVAQIKAVSATRLGLTLACGTATFPEEAITFDSLVRQAEQRLQNVVSPDDHSYAQSVLVQ